MGFNRGKETALVQFLLCCPFSWRFWSSSHKSTVRRSSAIAIRSSTSRRVVFVSRGACLASQRLPHAFMDTFPPFKEHIEFGYKGGDWHSGNVGRRRGVCGMDIWFDGFPDTLTQCYLDDVHVPHKTWNLYKSLPANSSYSYGFSLKIDIAKFLAIFSQKI